MSRGGHLRIPIQFLLVALVLVLALQWPPLLVRIGLHVPALPMPWGSLATSHLVSIAIAALVALVIGQQRGQLLANFGLTWNGWRGPALTLLATTPIWAGLFLHGHMSSSWSWTRLAFFALLFPLATEIVQRGFGFAFTRNDLHWRVAAAILVQALLFALVRWYTGGGGLGVPQLTAFLIAAGGAALLATLDALDGDTLWSGFAYHASLAAAWIVFALPGTVASGWAATWPRLFSAALALVLLWLVRSR